MAAKNHWMMALLMAILSLTGCGGSGGGDSSYTVTTTAGKGGTISPAAATVGEGEVMTFVVTPDSHYSIHSVSGCGGSLSGDTYTTGAITVDCTVTASFYPDPVSFTNGQAASVVIGQADFTSSTTTITQSSVRAPVGNPIVIDGTLYVPDNGSDRVLGFNAIPSSNGANADFVIGVSDFTTRGSLGNPESLAYYNGRLFVQEFSNNRISVYDPVPAATTTTPAYTITATSAGGFLDLEGIAIGGGKLVATDSSNHRVLIWNSVPTADTAPDLVLGQADFAGTSANRGSSVAADSMNYPAGVWTDGERLVVLDVINNRALIWNSFPTSNGQAADLVLGQADFTSNSDNRGLAAPTASTINSTSYGVFVSGNQLFVSDGGNNRVLIWNSWPTVNGQAADNVLGQADFTTATTGTSDTTFNYPTGAFLHGTQLFVADYNNRRYLIFNGSY